MWGGVEDWRSSTLGMGSRLGVCEEVKIVRGRVWVFVTVCVCV